MKVIEKIKKEANDKVKGVVFSKLSRLITLAVHEGGNIPDPSHNFKLRLIIDKAKSLNMPKENIQRAIEKANKDNKNVLREVMYEGFAPHGVALMIHATTDNPNRTVNEIKNCIEQHGGKLGTQGSVSYLFTKCGMVEFDKGENTEEDIFTFAQSLNAIDMDKSESIYYVYIPFELFGKIKEHLEKVRPKLSEVIYKPNLNISVSTHDQISQVLGVMEAVEGLDDVHGVFSNIDIPDSFHI